MWHEARKQEKKIREVMVNYQKRAERRREHYDKLRGDPYQLLRIHGLTCKLHLDPKTSSNLDSTMIPCQGDHGNIISQYDVRMHMDYIPDYGNLPEPKLSKEAEREESRCNYERYRTLVQSAFHKLGEGEALTKIAVEEEYAEPVGKKTWRKKKKTGAAIGYSYGNREYQQKKDEQILAVFLGDVEEESEEKAFSSESEYEIDMDVDSFKPYEVDRLNVVALDFGMKSGAFSRSLRAEKSELVEQKLARITEMEKTSLSGRKSRKDRRNWTDNQPLGPQLPSSSSLVQKDSSTHYGPNEVPDDGQDQSSSGSSSPGPESEGKVEFITEFGGDSDQENKELLPKQPSSASKSDPKADSKVESRRDDDHTHRESRHGRDREESREGNWSHDRERSRDWSHDQDRYERSHDRRRSSHDRYGERRDSRSGWGQHHRHQHWDRPGHYSSHYRRGGAFHSRSRSRDRYYPSHRRSHRSYSRSRSRDRHHHGDRNRGHHRDKRERDRRERHHSRSRSRGDSRSRERGRREVRSRDDSRSRERGRREVRSRSDSQSKERGGREIHSRSNSQSKERGGREVRSRSDSDREERDVRSRSASRSSERVDGEVRSRSNSRSRGREKRDARSRSDSQSKEREEKDSHSRSNSRSTEMGPLGSRKAQSRDEEQHMTRDSRSRSESSCGSERPPVKRFRSKPQSMSRSRSRSRSPSPVKRSDESAGMKSVARKPAVAVKKFGYKDKMMKKMQALLNKQHKTDRKAQKAKDKIKKAEKMDREEELREQVKKMKEAAKDEPEEASYTISGAAKTYETKSPTRSRSSSPDSPLKILTEGCSQAHKDNEFYYGRFS